MKNVFYSALLYAALSSQVYAKDSSANDTQTRVLNSQTASEGAERVTGLYKVRKIEKNPGNDYVLHFEAENKDGVHDLLVLKSDGLNVKIEEGQVLKLSAEVLKDSKKEQEITQVLVFLPSSEYGLSPVWLLSKAHEIREMRGARYLEMHAPASDYQVY